MHTRLDSRGMLLAAAVTLLTLTACSKKEDVPAGGMPPGFGDAGQTTSPADLEAWEKRDLGVKAQDTLHAGATHGATPTEIPGGKLITTQQLIALQQTAGPKLVLLEVLGAPQTLPNAFRAVPAAAPGDFKDQTQQQFAQVLQQLTQGDKNAPIVTYCANPECWMSYNAALRAINAGYTNVNWYRGGLEAWQRAGQPLSGGQPPMQGPPGQLGQQPIAPPMQQDMPPQQQGYPPQQGYPQQQEGFPPQQGYPQQQAYPPPQQGAYPQQQGYPPQQQGYPPPQQGGYPQQQGYPPQQQGGYPQNE
jgi:PQQ-dependent catabolism-associated CXXCW motif protein